MTQHAEASENTTSEEPVRRCWRCLQMFPADPTVDARSQHDFWLCTTCHSVLLPATAGDR